MELEVKGDNVLKAADIMQRCHLLFNYMNPEVPSEPKEDDREVITEFRSSIGSDDR